MIRLSFSFSSIIFDYGLAMFNLFTRVVAQQDRIDKFNQPWPRAFEKIFHTFDKNVIKQCQLFTGYTSMLHMYALKVMSFLETLIKSGNMMLKSLSTNLSMDDLSRLAILLNSNTQILSLIIGS